MRRAVCALLLAIALPAPGAEQPDLRVFESAELSQSMLRLGLQDDWDWVPVSLPHNWSLHPPKLGRFGAYRLRLNLEYVPPRGQSLYIPKLSLGEATVYFNREPIWRLSEAYAAGVAVGAVRIPVPDRMLRVGENTIHIEVSGNATWSHGISRVYFGDTNALAARAAKRNLLQGQMIHIVAAAFGAIGLLSLWLWLRARHDAALFWYGVSGVVLLLSTVVWYVTMWRADFAGERLVLIFMRYYGYLVPLFVLHLRLAGRKHLALETVMWLLLAAACVSIAIPSRWQALAWTGWGLSFAVLPALFVIPLLRSARLRGTPAVQFLVAADIAATLATLHDWGIRFGVLDFDRFILIYFVPPFVMLAAAVPILERMLAGVKATEQMRKDLEVRVAEKAREIEASHEKLLQVQREQALAEERRRIMADMHDGMGARLVALLSVAQSGKARHGEISEGIAAALDELRLTVDSVQPVEGDVGVVLGNVRHRMRSVFERAGVQLNWNVSELPRMDDLTPERILAIQRIVLETFSNAIRHSGARAVSVFTLRVPGAVRIVI